MNVSATGITAFIGSYVALKLLERGDKIIGFENLNDYYDAKLEKARFDRTMVHSPRHAVDGRL